MRARLRCAGELGAELERQRSSSVLALVQLSRSSVNQGEKGVIKRWRDFFGSETGGDGWKGGARKLEGEGWINVFIDGMECVRACFILALKASGAREEAASRGKRCAEGALERVQRQLEEAHMELERERGNVRELEATIDKLGANLLSTVDEWFGDEGGGG
jgi:hypothetical protein